MFMRHRKEKKKKKAQEIFISLNEAAATPPRPVNSLSLCIPFRLMSFTSTARPFSLQIVLHAKLDL